MKISEVIARVKAYSRGLDPAGNPIDDATTRDQVLYGKTDRECTGIVATCFASVTVIEEAHRRGANLIISHEALFWNHGDHTQWLEQTCNSVYLRKKQLMDEYGITVWRDHDYIHSGIPDGKGGWYDGIFRGFLHVCGLEEYYIRQAGVPVQYKIPFQLALPGLTVRETAEKIITGAGLNGLRIIGNPDITVHRAMLPHHILMNGDNEKITDIESHGIELIITMEMIDYTVNEFMRDSIYLGDNRAIISVGHFNLEEPGMEYMLTWLPEALGTDQISMSFVKSGDMNTFLVR